MKKFANQLFAALAGIWRYKSNTTQPNPAENESQKLKLDELEFCCHPRHGASPPRRKYQASGVSARGHEFQVYQCSAPGCGEFVSFTLDTATGMKRILFRGKFFDPHRESTQRAAFPPIRTAQTAA